MDKLKLALVISVYLCLPGCKTLDSATSGLANIASSIGGSSYTAEQIASAQNTSLSLYSDLQTAMNTIESNQLSEFAPERVNDAKSEFEKVAATHQKGLVDGAFLLNKTSLFSSQTNLQVMQEQHATIQRLVAESVAIKDKQLAILRPVDELYVILDKFNAQQVFAKRYEQTLGYKKSLIAEIRSGNEAKQNQILDNLLKLLSELEKSVVQHFYFDELSSSAAALAKTDLAKQVNVAFSEFNQALAKGILFTQQNVRQYQEIEQLQKSTQHLLARAQMLNDYLNRIKLATKEMQLETELLKLESGLLSVSQALGLGDIRHLSFEQQLDTINSALKNQ